MIGKNLKKKRSRSLTSMNLIYLHPKIKKPAELLQVEKKARKKRMILK
jgi:hypothetical protein